MSVFPLFKIILSFVGVVTFIVLTAVTYSYKLGLALKLVSSPATNFILSEGENPDLICSRSVQRFSISACNKLCLMLCLLLVSTLTSTVQAQGYIDCATIISDDDQGSFNVTEAKVVNGFTYLMVSTSYNDPSSDRFPVINGEPSVSPGFAAETYFAIFDPACNQIKGTYISALQGRVEPTDLEIDAAGNAYVLSIAADATGVATTDGTTTSGDDNFVLHKYDAAGNLIFSTIYGGSDGFDDRGAKVATDGNDVYVYGASDVTGGSVILPIKTDESIATDNQVSGAVGHYSAKLNPVGSLCSSNYVPRLEQTRNYLIMSSSIRGYLILS